MIDIYGKPFCDACEVAINIVEQAGKPYNYYNIEQLTSEELTYLLTDVAPGAKTVPIIIIDGRIIGDLDEFRSNFSEPTQLASTRLG